MPMPEASPAGEHSCNMLAIQGTRRAIVSRVLVAGCGDIGARLGVQLSADGHEVWGLRRSAGELPAPMRLLQADLTVAGELVRLPEGIDAVVYTATADSYDDLAYESAYVRGPRTLLQALAAAGQMPRRIIFVSSTSVYAQDDGGWVDEDSPAESESFSGRRLMEGERVVLDGPLPAIVVRFGGIYGPGRNRLLERVRDGKPCRETPPLFTNRIHRDDCAATLRHLLMLDGPERIYLGVDCAPAPQCEVMDWLASRLGVSPPPRTSPADAARGGGRGSNKRCRNDRLLSSGYRFIYPTYREGYSAVLEG